MTLCVTRTYSAVVLPANCASICNEVRNLQYSTAQYSMKTGLTSGIYSARVNEIVDYGDMRKLQRSIDVQYIICTVKWLILDCTNHESTRVIRGEK